MALTPGTRLGPYEIAAQIGEGGMGEVYRATDTTLNRQVAVKVLPESLAADAERIARFEREAKILASLNHSDRWQFPWLERCSDKTFLRPERRSTEQQPCQQPRQNRGSAATLG